MTAVVFCDWRRASSRLTDNRQERVTRSCSIVEEILIWNSTREIGLTKAVLYRNIGTTRHVGNRNPGRRSPTLFWFASNKEGLTGTRSALLYFVTVIYFYLSLLSATTAARRHCRRIFHLLFFEQRFNVQEASSTVDF